MITNEMYFDRLEHNHDIIKTKSQIKLELALRAAENSE